MEHTDLVANELQNAGFDIGIINIGGLELIEVSLSKRKVNNMEVRCVLEQCFEDIGFTLRSTSNGVLVKI